MKTKMITKLVATGLCLFCGLNLWAAHPAFNKTNPLGEDHPRGGGGIIWGDYNSDGKPDALIIGGEWSGATFPKLFQNNGDKTFTNVTATVFGSEFSTPLYKGAAAWLDYDKDGALDLIISGQQGTNDGDPTITKVYKNAGSTGSYALAEDASITLQAVQSGNEEVPAQYIAIADYDGDTYLDVLIAGVNGSDKYFYLYKNNGTAGGFTRNATPFNGGEFPAYDQVALSWGDFNGDGKPDILYSGHKSNSNPDFAAGIYKNKGNGTFEHIELPSGTYHGEVAWIDYNHDGKLDALITGTYWDGNMQYWNTYLYTNNGDDTFTPVENHGLPATCNSSVAVGDIDKDGYDDLVIIGQNQGGGSNVFYNNRGDSTLLFAGTMVLELVTVQKGLVRLVDVDSDGDLDISIAGDYIIPVLYENKYPEPEIPPTIPPFPEPAPVDLVEFTEVATPVGGTAAFPLNLTQGGAAWGDYDNDGNLDVLIWGVYDNDGVPLAKLYKNNGNGTFTDKTADILGPSFPKFAKGTAAWLDFNNDGNLDLIISGATTVNDDASKQTTVTKLYTNDPLVGNMLLEETTMQNLFPPFDYEKKGGIARNIAVADYNNDGWQDILFCSRYTDVDLNETERHFEIYKNKAGKTFELQSNTNTGLIAGNGGGVAWGDYNRDGYQDILFSGYRDNVEGGYRSGVFTNNGDGTFTETLFYTEGEDFGFPADGKKPFGAETGEVTWIDVNADGYLDAIVTGSTNTYNFNGDLHIYNSISWQWWTALVFLYDPATETFGAGVPNEMGTRLGRTCESGITWVDLNDDGLPDVITSGQYEGSSISYNTSNGVFNRQAFGKNFQQGGITVVDFDKDGKLDIFATGTEGTLLLKNTSSITPAAPAAPTGFTATPGADGELTLSWTASSDPTLRYNIFAKKAISAYSNLIISLAPVDEATGALKVNYDHLALLSTNTYALKGIDGGEYTVGVQAVSINGKTSAFTTATVTVAGGSGGTSVDKELPGSFVAYRSDDAIVVTTDIAQEAVLEVYNVAGSKVWSAVGSLTGATQISGLPRGQVYFVTLRVDGKVAVRKVAL